MRLRHAWHILVHAGLGLAGTACGDNLVAHCEVDTDCADGHAACGDGTCACSAGYSPDEVGACVWSGVIADPAFQSNDVWQVGPGVTIDPGGVQFRGDALCALSRVSQLVTMPKLSRAEPLVIELTPRAAFAFGTTWQDTLNSGRIPTAGTRWCLGASAYAPESAADASVSLPFTLMPAAVDPDCRAPGHVVTIDHVDVKPANVGECSPPRAAVNGDFEGEGGWSFDVYPDLGHPAPASATIEDGIGENASRGLRLFLSKTCGQGYVANAFSVPRADQVASPALSYFVRTSSGSVVSSVGGDGTLPNTGLWSPFTSDSIGSKHTMCLPPSMRGNVFAFWSDYYSGAATCDQVVNGEAIYDNLEVVNDPRCGLDPAIVDPGFESTANTLLGAFATPGVSIARASNDPANAHGGNGVLQLRISSTCNDPFFVANVVVPPSIGPAGPALAFFYKAPIPVAYKLVVQPPESGMPPSLTYDDTYHRGVVCLNPHLAERSQRVSFGLSPAAPVANCDQPITPEQAFVDDFAVTTDASCPSSWANAQTVRARLR